ncbi:hypothetical protein HLH26_19705 [Gluconacetobacter sp. 1b LMG 1731]|uniref:Porin n=1 Tax=Gluconacetobacter dulcium TaxID=2729096 RepID=A0A7W4NUL1_9PROT|nr:hypothetical protein [Gluconacetobacter dulcium]MBB2166709.1 hypothetical protein [Gluconacetobacter dulcium]MBB2195811.1 hypothetical protein [Gluconacetobacter dulcium]
MRLRSSLSALFCSTALLGTVSTIHSAAAADSQSAQMRELREEMLEMRGQIKALKARLGETDKNVRAVRRVVTHHSEMSPNTAKDIRIGEPAPARPGILVGSGNGSYANQTGYARVTGMPISGGGPNAPLHKGQFKIGGVKITLGGFFEMAGIYRSRNETADISSNFAAIPWMNSPNAHMNEFHQTERQSRFAGLVEGDLNNHLHVAGYTELDFQGAGSSSNSRQSNSYVLRSRLMYASLEDKANEWYVSGGQMWSMATMFKKGMGLRDENIPLVIDAQYLPGFTWTRNTGVRVVKGFNHGEYHVGLALENPQAVWGGTTYKPPGSTAVTINNPGGQVENSDTTYSDDIAPDIILKATADESFGHFEALGMMRFFHDRVSYLGHGRSHVTVGGGGGGAMLIPIVKHKLDFQASGLVGDGVGRYGTSSLADATTNRFGTPVAMPEAQVMAGLIGHPIKALDIYAYGGMEDILSGRFFNVGNSAYGYGNPNYVTTGCDVEGAAAATCGANIKRVTQGTLGFWWRYMQGDYGTLQFGMQYSYTDVAGFRGAGGAPHTDDNMVFLSMRYLPFQ